MNGQQLQNVQFMVKDGPARPRFLVGSIREIKKPSMSFCAWLPLAESSIELKKVLLASKNSRKLTRFKEDVRSAVVGATLSNWIDGSDSVSNFMRTAMLLHDNTDVLCEHIAFRNTRSVQGATSTANKHVRKRRKLLRDSKA
jgi:hypothetical protein